MGLASNSKKEILKPFWNEAIQEKSKKFLSCTNEDCEELDLDSDTVSNPPDSILDPLISSAKRLLKGSWFTTKMIKLERTSALNSEKPYPLPLSLLPKEMSAELDKKPKKVKNWRKNQSKGKPAKKAKEAEDKTKPEKEPKEPAGKCSMIRLFHNKSQRRTMNGWYGTHRWTYNKVVYAQQEKRK